MRSYVIPYNINYYGSTGDLLISLGNFGILSRMYGRSETSKNNKDIKVRPRCEFHDDELFDI